MPWRPPRSSLPHRSPAPPRLVPLAAVLQGATMACCALWVLFVTARRVMGGAVCDAAVVGVVGVAASLATFAVAALVYRFRNGASNMASVWVCTRSDVIGNLAVMLGA